MRSSRRSALSADGAALMLLDREREVLLHVAAGLDHTTISRALGINRGTTVTYTNRISQAAGARSRSELATWAILMGVVTPDEIVALWRAHRPELAAWVVRFEADSCVRGTDVLE